MLFLEYVGLFRKQFSSRKYFSKLRIQNNIAITFSIICFQTQNYILGFFKCSKLQWPSSFIIRVQVKLYYLFICLSVQDNKSFKLTFRHIQYFDSQRAQVQHFGWLGISHGFKLGVGRYITKKRRKGLKQYDLRRVEGGERENSFTDAKNGLDVYFCKIRVIYQEIFKNMICIIINMLTQQIVEQQAENRRGQRSIIPLGFVLQRLNIQDYENLIEWIFENSEYLRLSCSTKFLARTFFDAAVLQPEVIPYDQNIALALAALALAIKFNQGRELSQQLTLQALLTSANIRLSLVSFLGLEAKVMRALSFSFIYTTPDDYLNIFMEKFPFVPAFRKAIPKYLELAMMRPLACQFQAQELFYGSVLAIINIHKPELNQFQKHILVSLTGCWQKAKQVAQMIQEALSIAENEPLDA